MEWPNFHLKNSESTRLPYIIEYTRYLERSIFQYKGYLARWAHFYTEILKVVNPEVVMNDK